MEERTENRNFESESDWDASARTEAMRLSFPEYFEKQKPDYEWTEEGNLIAYIQFDSFPEEVFRKFIEAKKLEIKKQRYYNPGDGKPSYLIPDDAFIDENDKKEIGWEEKPRRILWSGGVLIEGVVWDNDNKESQVALIEVCKSQGDFRIWLRAKGNHDSLKKKIMTDTLFWFEQNAGIHPLVNYFVCTCSKCLDKPFQSRYAIQGKYILNFYQNHIPEIQCYESGEQTRLDKLSDLTQPPIRCTILHQDTDEEYLKTLLRHFPQKKQGDYNISVWDKTQILPGNNEDEDLEKAIEEADVLIALISADFTSDDKIIQKYLPKVISRRDKGNALLLPFEIRSCAWDYLFRVNSDEIPYKIVLSRPNQEDAPTDKSWYDASLQINSNIKKWVRSR